MKLCVMASYTKDRLGLKFLGGGGGGGASLPLPKLGFYTKDSVCAMSAFTKPTWIER